MNNRKTPRIRFKGFTDDWEQRKLGDIVGIYDGVHQTPNYQNSGVMFLSVENIATLKSSKFISEEDFKRDYKVFPQEKDILMTRIGDVGTTNVVTDNGLKAYYVSLALLKYKSTDPYFLSNAIQSDYVQKGLANRTLKTAIPMKINKDEIGKVSVMLPLSATEQQQIGTYFRHLDHLITLHQRKLEKLKIVKKAMLENCFPKNGEKVPRFRFSGFTCDWEQRKLSELVAKYEDPVETPHGGYIRLGIRSHAKGTFHEYVEPGHELETAKMHRVATNKLIFNITFAWEHAVAIANENDAGKLVSHRFPQFTLLESLRPEFLKYVILDEGFHHNLYLASPGGAGRNRVLKIEEALDYPIYYPSLEEQHKIGGLLNKLNDLITLHQRKLEKLKLIKKSFLEKMFV